MDAHEPTAQSGERPLISVIMAAYNAERFVGEAIDSVLAQTYANWELVCVDDCSADGTVGVVEDYAAREARVRLIRNATNLGAAQSRNVAIENAQGEYLAILDADDVSLPDRFERSLRAFAESDERTGLVGSQAYFIDEDGTSLGESTMTCLPEYLTGEVIPDASPMRHSSWMMRADVVRALCGYEAAFRGSHDYDLYLRLTREARAVYLEPPMVKWRWHSGQISSQLPRTQEAMRLLARARRAALNEGRAFDLQAEYERALASMPVEKTLSRDVSRVHYQMGRRYLTVSATERARHEFGLALRADRAYWKPWVALLLTYLPASLRSRVLR